MSKRRKPAKRHPLLRQIEACRKAVARWPAWMKQTARAPKWMEAMHD